MPFLTRLSRVPIRFDVSDGSRGVSGDDKVPRSVEADGHGLDVVPIFDVLPDDRARRAGVLRQMHNETPGLENQVQVSRRIQRRGRLHLNGSGCQRPPEERSGRSSVFRERDRVAELVRRLQNHIAGRIHEERHDHVVRVIIAAVGDASGPQGIPRHTVELHQPDVAWIAVPLRRVAGSSRRRRSGRSSRSTEGFQRGRTAARQFRCYLRPRSTSSRRPAPARPGFPGCRPRTRAAEMFSPTAERQRLREAEKKRRGAGGGSTHGRPKSSTS